MPTTVSVDWDTGPGVVIDLSTVFQDREALPLVMMAATSWLQAAMTALAPGRRELQVADEVWALLENEWTVRHLQARLKLCRHWGVCNILVCHRLSDLRAQFADGTAAKKVAAGLLGDTAPGSSSSKHPTKSPTPKNCSDSPTSKRNSSHASYAAGRYGESGSAPPSSSTSCRHSNRSATPTKQ